MGKPVFESAQASQRSSATKTSSYPMIQPVHCAFPRRDLQAFFLYQAFLTDQRACPWGPWTCFCLICSRSVIPDNFWRRHLFGLFNFLMLERDIHTDQTRVAHHSRRDLEHHDIYFLARNFKQNKVFQRLPRRNTCRAVGLSFDFAVGRKTHTVKFAITRIQRCAATTCKVTMAWIV